MTVPTYTDAMGEALERLRPLGYEWGSRSFVNHAPMAAEALAHMGYTGELHTWLGRVDPRDYHEVPGPRFALSADDPAQWRSALGDFGRVGDWTVLFERELALHPWQQVLRVWWPRLLPGAPAMLGHGVIRTAHAVRAVANADAGADNRPQLGELARGLGYWAARHQPLPEAWDTTTLPAATDRTTDAETSPGEAALDALVVESATLYATARQRHPIPLIHAVTTPAAIRLVCAHLPPEQHASAYRAAAASVRTMRSYFVDQPPAAFREPAGGTPRPDELFARAFELGDDHAIKLAEVAVRHGGAQAGGPLAAAAHSANEAIGRLLR